MARFNPKSFAQPDLLKKIQVRNLLELLSPHQAFLEAMGLLFPTDGNEGFDYLKLAGILAPPDEAMDSSLVEALHVIGNLGTDERFDEVLGSPTPNKNYKHHNGQYHLFSAWRSPATRRNSHPFPSCR